MDQANPTPAETRHIYEAEVEDSAGRATLFIPARLSQEHAQSRFLRVLEAGARVLSLRPIPAAAWPEDGRRGVRGAHNVWFDAGRLSYFKTVSGAYRGLCHGVDPSPARQAEIDTRVTREAQRLLWRHGLGPKPKPKPAPKRRDATE